MSTLGADPEFFLRDTRTGSVVPACGLIGGSKDEPVQIPNMKKGHMMQEDNVMVEFNIPPSKRASTFMDNILNTYTRIMDNIRRDHPDYEADDQCARLFTNDALRRHKQALEFGCDIDFNSYSGEGDPYSPVSPSDLKDEGGQWRFAGGHLHIGYDVPIPHYVVANLADVFIGLRLVSYDKQGGRRNLYGQAGRYRPKEYGIEYRTLSNKWLVSQDWMGTTASCAFNLITYLNGTEITKIQKTYAEVPWVDVQNAINNEDENLAEQLTMFCLEELKLSSRGGI